MATGLSLLYLETEAEAHPLVQRSEHDVITAQVSV